MASRHLPMHGEDELVFHGEITDFITSNANASKYFHRTMQIKRRVDDPEIPIQSAYVTCIVCKEFFEVEGTVDLYQHLYSEHRNNFIKAMTSMSDESVYSGLQPDRIKFVKEEVKAVMFIQHYMSKDLRSLRPATKRLIAKKVRDIFNNRLESHIFEDDRVFSYLLDTAENYLESQIAL